MRIFICGDSTAACYQAAETQMAGWGQMLPEFLPDAQVFNHAMAGRSTKTFLAEGRLQRLDGQLGRGDLLLIQFGHNDEGDKPERHTDPETEFQDNLKKFIRFAEKREALPVLLTPICIRLWENGKLQPSHGAYLEAIRLVAREQRIPLIEMYEESRRIVSEAGEEGSKALYMQIPPGEDPRYPEGVQDNTHTRLAAARPFAAFAAAELRRIAESSGC